MAHKDGMDDARHPNRQVGRDSYYNRAIGASAAAIPMGAAVAKLGGSISQAAYQVGDFSRPGRALAVLGTGAVVGGAGSLAYNISNKRRAKKEQ